MDLFSVSPLGSTLASSWKTQMAVYLSLQKLCCRCLHPALMKEETCQAMCAVGSYAQIANFFLEVVCQCHTHS